MRWAPPPSLQSLAAAATDASMSSSTRFPPRGRNHWRRGFSGRDGGGGEVFPTCDLHFRTVRDGNYGFPQGERGNYRVPMGYPMAAHRPMPPYRPRPPPRPRPDDYRSWETALHQPPPHCERFTMLSYNILADYLAKDHRHRLYFHIPPYILDWEWRKRRILIELGLWSPDIICLQEVDRFEDLQGELKIRGYCGVWKMRTGPPVDGCAIFWRTTRFRLVHEEQIEYDKLGLRNNVAQICVLESRNRSSAENGSAGSPTSSYHPRGSNQVVVCNIHVLYNPNRGDIKIGQVRILLDRAHAVSRDWNNAPVIICGDFNCIPKSPLYNFISEQKLNLSGLAKNQVSGQSSASIDTPRMNGPNPGHSFNRVQSPKDNSSVPSASADNHAVSDNLTDMQQISLGGVKGASLTDTFTHPLSVNGVLDAAGKPCVDDCYKENKMISDAAVGGKGQNITLDGSSDECGSTQYGLLDAIRETVNSHPHQGKLSIDQPNLYKSTALEEESFPNDLEKEKLDFIMTSALCEANVGDIRTRNDRKLSDALTSDCSSSDVVSGTSLPGDFDISLLEGMENLSSESITVEEKTKSSISYQSNHKHELLDASTCIDPVVDRKGFNLSPDKVGQIIKEDEGLCGNMRTAYSPVEMLRCGTKDASSYDVNYENKIVDLEVAMQSLEVCSSTSKLQGDNEAGESSSEHCFGVHQSAETSNMLDCKRGSCAHGNVEESPEKETIYAYREEIVSDASTSDQTQSSPYLDENQSQKFLSFEGQTDNGEVSVGRFDATIPQDSQFDELSTLLEVEPLDSKETEISRIAYDPHLWTPVEIAAASGSEECTIVEHHLNLKSAYAQVEDYAGTKDTSREPEVTSYNRQFMGTVDYIWCSEGLQTVQVLDTIPKRVLQQTPGFPTRKWGSDHLALACQLAFTRDLPTEGAT